MKILLQHTQTLQYLRADKSWTRKDAEAFNFQHSQKAIEFAHEHQIRDAYVAVKFIDGEDIVAPIPEMPMPLPATGNAFVQARF
jgi:hypothetical protein